jgi:hypothetical protein
MLLFFFANFKPQTHTYAHIFLHIVREVYWYRCRRLDLAKWDSIWILSSRVYSEKQVYFTCIFSVSSSQKVNVIYLFVSTRQVLDISNGRVACDISSLMIWLRIFNGPFFATFLKNCHFCNMVRFYISYIVRQWCRRMEKDKQIIMVEGKTI